MTNKQKWLINKLLDEQYEVIASNNNKIAVQGNGISYGQRKVLNVDVKEASAIIDALINKKATFNKEKNVLYI